MHTQEMYYTMSKVPGKNTWKYIELTKLVVEYNMSSYNPKDNLLLKGQENILLWNILMLHTKL